MPALSNRPRSGQTLRRPGAVSPRTGLLRVAVAALRPLAVAAGVATAGAAVPALAHADSPTDSIASALNGGAGNNGSLSNALAGIGRSICPSLVKPGATLASITSQVAGTKGLSPGMAGLVTSMAIQMECPGFMTSLANGNMPFPLPGLGGQGLPSLPGVGLAPNALGGLAPNALGGLGR